MDKFARLQLFYERLGNARAPSTHDESLALLRHTLDAIEDEHSGVPNKPDNWTYDGRLYPPQADSAYALDAFPGIVRYRSIAHNTYIARNGAIEIKSVATNEIEFSKVGADGKGVWE